MSLKAFFRKVGAYGRGCWLLIVMLSLLSSPWMDGWMDGVESGTAIDMQSSSSQAPPE